MWNSVATSSAYSSRQQSEFYRLQTLSRSESTPSRTSSIRSTFNRRKPYFLPVQSQLTNSAHLEYSLRALGSHHSRLNQRQVLCVEEFDASFNKGHGVEDPPFRDHNMI
ncbi:hypothetical protein AAG570_002456 [Ranatra chinensis]|uniref:Uncharacterized protein n=1 Tax=Ranatra chinensis TaxID=642074 RepID=A0ABD0Y7K7_9HEMI